MYLTLEQTKRHLNLDSSYTDDDLYIVDLIGLVETVVEKHINQKLSYMVWINGGVLPTPLIHAMLLILGNFYANREVATLANVNKLPLNYEYLLDFYKNYEN